MHHDNVIDCVPDVPNYHFQDNVTESSASEGSRGQERREEEEGVDNTDMVAAASSSFYAVSSPLHPPVQLERLQLFHSQCV